MSSKTIRGSSLVSHTYGSYTWKIQNSNQWKKFKPICSPLFTFPDIISYPWSLELYPSTTERHIGIVLKLLSDKRFADLKRVQVSFFVEQEESNISLHKHSAICDFMVNPCYTEIFQVEYSFDQFLPYKYFFNLTYITIVCEITMENVCSEINSETEDIQNVIDQRAKLVLDFNNLLKSERFSDAILISSCGKKFQVHKSILAARSTVFSAMFENDMKEKQENLVEIKDVDAETLEELILFIYTGNVNNLKSAVISLLAAADKYAIEDLKLMCEKVLNENVDIDNAIDILALADLHHAGLLKQKVLRFITKHLKSVMETPAFKALTNETHPHLIEILGDISKIN